MSAITIPTTPWPILPGGVMGQMCDLSVESPAITGLARQSATNVLWSLTGMRFGTTQVKIRPCTRPCLLTSFPGYGWDAWPGTGWGTLLAGGGQWGWGAVPIGCGSCGDDCDCGALSEIVLPEIVNDIVEVRVDGAVMVSGTGYRLDNNRRLVRLDGKIWPACQSLVLADTMPGTFSVTALYGEDVPPDAAWAVSELMCEFIRSYHGSNDCALPPNVVALTQQGVSLSTPEGLGVIATQFGKAGLTGLRRVDMFVQTYNPGGLRQRARAYSVDRSPLRRTGG